jgi:hypothetical protein
MVMETASLLLIVSIAIDKALSLAKPLHYSDIVTFFSVNVYVIIIFSIALVVGVVLPLTVVEDESTHTFKVRTYLKP